MNLSLAVSVRVDLGRTIVAFQMLLLPRRFLLRHHPLPQLPRLAHQPVLQLNSPHQRQRVRYIHSNFYC